MRWRLILYVVGLLTLFFGLTMAAPLAASLFFRDGSGIPMLISLAITILFGAAMTIGFRGAEIADIRQREGMAIVFFGWTAMGFFGALPFYMGCEGVYQRKKLSITILEQKHDPETLDPASGGPGRGPNEHAQK